MDGRHSHLVVSGTYRSGTTFVERLIDNLSDGFCAPQPFPYLYFEAKRRFLAETGRATPSYPIGTGFHDPSHHPDELAAVLRSEVLDRAAIDDAFRSMQGYSGAQTPELADVAGHIPTGRFADLVRNMHELLAQARSSTATVLASKEILVEEFAPTLRAADVAVLLVIRDPRAVAASTIGPGAALWTGEPRPLLHTIRLWRKSVAYAIQRDGDTAYARFEDFTARPVDTLRRVLRSLGIASAGDVREPWLDARGLEWTPNTSFPSSDTRARPQFGLTDRQLAYVEALARPEMLHLGYEPLADRASVADALAAFRADDDPGRAHPAFAADFSVDPAQLALEQERLRHLASNTPLVDEPCWFVRPGVREQLASALAGDTVRHP